MVSPGQLFLRLLLGTHAACVTVATWLPWSRRRLTPGRPRTVVLTGTFYSENWIMNHLGPLAASETCAAVWIVCTFPIPPTPKVTVVRPWRWLTVLSGETPARLATFVWTCLHKRPDIVGGFHILLNGLLAVLVARVIGSRSLYFCGGGPREVLDGGFQSDNRLFALLKKPDPWLEQRLLRAVDRCDAVITMGSRSVKFFRDRGVNARCEVLPGGIRSSGFRSDNVTKQYDLILVGRLVAVKRVDVFLRAIKLLASEVPNVRAVIVGRGDQEDSLRNLAVELELGEQVTFAGFQKDVASWLARSRIFVLTSDSEGLSLAMMEAMMAGLPCVVSDVGELGEIVESGFNGHLVKERSPDAFARILHPLLIASETRESLSSEARKTASRFEFSEAVRRWNEILPAI